MNIMIKISAWVPVLIGLIWIYVVVRKKRIIQKGELFWAIISEIVFILQAALVTFIYFD